MSNEGLDRMSLDDAIAHANEVAMCGGDCGEEHIQLSKWLLELKSLRYNMSNEQTIVIKLDAKEIIEEIIKLRETVEQLRKIVERFDNEGMPEIRQ